MALPFTFTGVQFPATGQYYLGPFKSSAGAFYVVWLDSTNQVPEVWKATDPADSWSEQNAAGKPSSLVWDSIDSLWAYQSGDILYIVFHRLTAIGYSTFSMAADSWQTPDITNTVETIADDPDSTYAGCSIVLRSDSMRIILYNGDQDTVMGVAYNRVDYARSTDGLVWTVGVAVDNAGEKSWGAGVAVLGASNRVHFFFASTTAGSQMDIYQRTASGASPPVLQTFAASFDEGAVTRPFGAGVAYASGGATKVRCPYYDYTAGGQPFRIAKFDSADAPTVTTELAGDRIPHTSAGTVAGNLALESPTKVWLVFPDVGGFGVYRDSNDNDAGWGADVLGESGNFTLLCVSFYSRLGDGRLAYLRDPTVYNEVVVTPAPTVFLPHILAAQVIG